MKYVLIVNFQPGVAETPMDEWKPEEIEAHLDYYWALQRELLASGELVEIGGPRRAGPGQDRDLRRHRRPVVTDGPFQEFKEWIAGYQIVDVESEARAIEIAAQDLGGAGPGRPRHRSSRSSSASSWRSSPRNAPEMEGYLETARGAVR